MILSGCDGSSPSRRSSRRHHCFEQHGILVNAVAPGSTLTDGTRALFYGEDGAFKDSVRSSCSPTSRWEGPRELDEIANAVLFLAAPESSYVHGHILTVDGGWTAGYIRDF